MAKAFPIPSILHLGLCGSSEEENTDVLSSHLLCFEIFAYREAAIRQVLQLGHVSMGHLLTVKLVLPYIHATYK